MFVRRDCPDLVQKRVTVEEKDCYYFSERELTFFRNKKHVDQQEIGNLLIFANSHFACVLSMFAC